ncbi:MAG: hypothetical protein ACQEQV_03075 [Fibrobacterota bacterium]
MIELKIRQAGQDESSENTVPNAEIEVFERAFDAMEWVRSDGTAPGAEGVVTALNREDATLLSVTVDPHAIHLFVLTLIYMKEKRLIFGLGPVTGRSRVVRRVYTPDAGVVRDCFAAFFAGRSAYLQTRVYQLPRAVSA